MIALILFFSLLASFLAQKTCIQKIYGLDAINCVCNSTYCDEVPPLGTISARQAVIYTTSASGKRFLRTTQNFESSTKNTIQIFINESQKFQNIIGFGGAFTDAAGINLVKLSPGAQAQLAETYFGPGGIGYTIGRTPIASCDFSTRAYSYDDTPGDMNLLYFALTNEDYNYKIPFIKMAQNLTGGKLKLFASPWSAPGWMKTTGQMKGGGGLFGDVNGPYYKTWANYFVRYFEEYAKNNITFWGVTMENEPEAGGYLNYNFQAMYFNSTMERDYAKGYWGQALRNNSVTKNLNLMVADASNRGDVPRYANDIFGDSVASSYINGIATHWYGDHETTAETLTQTHNKFPNKFILYSEACYVHGVIPGSWEHADGYAYSITEVLQNWVSGWTDWNLCLDPKGGPNWVRNWVDSPIIVSNTTDEFEKQPMYYALGHFSKFFVPDSTIIGHSVVGLGPIDSIGLQSVAAITPNGQKVVYINNRSNTTNYDISVVTSQGSVLNLSLESRSFTTLVYN